MKKNLWIIASCGLLLLAAGCKNDKDKEPEQTTTQSQTLYGNMESPSWSAKADYDYSSSMTAVVKVDLAAQYPDKAADFQLNDKDLLAAFSGEECLGVASPQDGLFFLYISLPADNSDIIGQTVALRYYSVFYTNIFEAADAFTFQSDGIQGSAANPFVPTWALN